MDLDIEALLAESGALLAGHFRLSSGLHSPNYVQCARLLEHPRNAAVIGAALAEGIGFLPDVAKIVSPALGGVIIGYAVAASLDIPFVFTERKDGKMLLRRGFRIEPGENVVVVEDVVTTGKSTRETIDVVRAAGGSVVGVASILNRSGSEHVFEEPYVCLLALDLTTYDPTDCPLCRAGVPLDSPGSRHRT
jgi:orotate phosphoribosyltransferase